MVGSPVSSNVRRHAPFRSPGHHRRTLSRALRMKPISNLIAATAPLFQWPRRASRKLRARSVARAINQQAVCVITLVSRTDGSERRHYAGSGGPAGAIESRYRVVAASPGNPNTRGFSRGRRGIDLVARYDSPIPGDGEWHRDLCSMVLRLRQNRRIWHAHGGSRAMATWRNWPSVSDAALRCRRSRDSPCGCYWSCKRSHEHFRGPRRRSRPASGPCPYCFEARAVDTSQFDR